MAYVRRLNRQPVRLRQPAAQPPLIPDDLARVLHDPEPDQPTLPGLPDATAPVEPTRSQRVAAELAVLSTEIDQHVIDGYRPLLDDIGVTPAADLLALRNGSEVFVAGVRVATQTPPMRSGRRVVFISLDDGTGCADCAFFPDAQEEIGALLFSSRLLVVQGRTRRTGQRGISIQGQHAWNLKTLWQSRHPA